MLRISLGYPNAHDEVEILSRQQRTNPIDSLKQVVTTEELIEAQAAVREIYVDTLIKEYIVGIVEATRKQEDVYLGASPRGSLALYRGSQARALLEGRNYVIPDDVKALADITLGHRLIMSPSARMKAISSSSIVEEILRQTPVPGARLVAR